MEDLHVPTGAVAVGIDGSPSARRALEQAVDIATTEHRPLLLVHAVGASESRWTDPGGHDNRVGLEDRETPGFALLADARAEAVRRSPDLDVHDLLHVADPRDVLIGVSQQAWLLVVGSRGHGPVLSVLLGSTSLAVTRGAACPVLVVRPHHRGDVRHGVLAGIDGSGDSVPTLDLAFAESARRGLPLTVLHVVPRVPRSVAEPTIYEVTEDELEQHRVWVGEAIAGLRELHPDVAVRIEVVPGVPHEELVQRAERMNLVVVGAHHGGLASELVLGSVAASVLEHAHTQVAVVPVRSRTSEVG